MGKYLPAQKRIVGVFGHHNSGKTTLLDAVLKNYYSGADRIGQRYLDSEPIEKEKAASFSNHITTVDFEDTRLYFIDTPGSTEFLG
ncbi:MAG TPA: GTP-binding protein, partial [Petrotogaceae bacterium]|nr:GTP-binding protein [Petrotogaceae bacterium]